MAAAHKNTVHAIIAEVGVAEVLRYIADYQKPVEAAGAEEAPKAAAADAAPKKKERKTPTMSPKYMQALKEKLPDCSKEELEIRRAAFKAWLQSRAPEDVDDENDYSTFNQDTFDAGWARIVDCHDDIMQKHFADVEAKAARKMEREAKASAKKAAGAANGGAGGGQAAPLSIASDTESDEAEVAKVHVAGKELVKDDKGRVKAAAKGTH
jgi:hypothetical protein